MSRQNLHNQVLLPVPPCPSTNTPLPDSLPALDDNSRALFPSALVFVNLYGPGPIFFKLPEIYDGVQWVVLSCQSYGYVS